MRDVGTGPHARFHRVSTLTATLVGDVMTLASIVIATTAWLGVGWWVAYPDKWFLTTNLGMTLATLLILLLLQHGRSVHRLAVQAKLDELIRSSDAGNQLSEREWRRIVRRSRTTRAQANRSGTADTGKRPRKREIRGLRPTDGTSGCHPR